MAPIQTLLAAGGPAGEATTTGAYTQAIARALTDKGIDSDEVFQAAGLAGRYTNDPMQRIPAAQMTRLFRLCVAATSDPYFGLAVADKSLLSSLHALGYSLMSSRTLMDFGQRLERYFRMLSDVATMRVEVDGDRVALVTTNNVETCPETQDAWLGIMVRLIRLLTRDEVDPLRVDFVHAMPAPGAAPYEEYFRCPVTFDGRDNVLVFDRARFELPLEGSSPDLARLNDTIAADYLVRLDRNDVVARVRDRICARLDSIQCDRNTIAHDLGMAPATLARKLAQRGSSFHVILDDTRRDLALNYLDQAHLPVTEIAFRLGFNDLSNFTRAFKRWTGQSPTAFRSGGAPARQVAPPVRANDRRLSAGD